MRKQQITNEQAYFLATQELQQAVITHRENTSDLNRYEEDSQHWENSKDPTHRSNLSKAFEFIKDGVRIDGERVTAAMDRFKQTRINLLNNPTGYDLIHLAV